MLAMLQAMADGNSFVENKTIALPSTFNLGNSFQVFQNATLKMVDLRPSARKKAVDFSQRIPPVQNICAFLGFNSPVADFLAPAGKSLKLAVAG